MTIWSLILVVLAGVSLAAGWRLSLNEPILTSIGLSGVALLLLIVSMIRDHSAKRKKVEGRPEGVLHAAAAGYGATALRPPVFPGAGARSDGYRDSQPFTEFPPTAHSAEPVDLAESFAAHEISEPETLADPEATVQILPPEAQEPLVFDAGGPSDTETVDAETEVFQIGVIEEEVAPAPEPAPEIALEPPGSPGQAPYELATDVSLGGDSDTGTPVQERVTPAAWGFHYLPPSPEESFAEVEAPTELGTPNPPEGLSGSEGARGGGRRPSRGEVPRRKVPGKLVYWWETPDQASARGAAERRRAGAPPARQPKSARESAPPAGSPEDLTHPAPKVSDSVSVTPAERTKPPEITIRLVPAPKRRTKPVAKHPKAKPAATTATSTTQARSEPTPSPSTPAPDNPTPEDGATKASQAGTTGKPAPAARARPTMAAKPATKLRAAARATSTGASKRSAKAKPAPKADADSTDESKAPTTSTSPPPEEESFKYLK